MRKYWTPGERLSIFSIWRPASISIRIDICGEIAHHDFCLSRPRVDEIDISKKVDLGNRVDLSNFRNKRELKTAVVRCARRTFAARELRPEQVG